MTLRVTNSSKQTVLATHAAVALTREERIHGLIGVRSMDPGTALLFPQCNAVHTVQMLMPIDILFIDMVHRVVVKRIRGAMPTCHFNTISLPAALCAVLELPAGTIEETGTFPGDALEFMSAGHCTQDELNQIGAL